MIGPLGSLYDFWMHLEVLRLVSNLYRALVVTEEALMRETLRYTAGFPEPAECTKITVSLTHTVFLINCFLFFSKRICNL